VPAEDEVETAADGVGVGVKVQPLEADERADLGPRFHEALLGPRALEQERAPVRGRDLPRLLERPDGRARGVEDAGRQVGAEDLDLPAARLREEAPQHHRDRVRLLARRAARAPDPDTPGPATGLGLARPAGEDLALQELEVARLAEEVGLVGRDGVQHPYALFA